MKTIEITFNGEKQEVKFVAGLTKADFKHHNQLTASDMSEQADIMYQSCLKAYAVKVQMSVNHIAPSKATLKAVRKGGEFLIQANLQYEHKADKVEHAELVKEWARKSMVDNIKRQEAAKAFLFQREVNPVTSNTSEKRIEPVVA